MTMPFSTVAPSPPRRLLQSVRLGDECDQALRGGGGLQPQLHVASIWQQDDHHVRLGLYIDTVRHSKQP